MVHRARRSGPTFSQDDARVVGVAVRSRDPPRGARDPLGDLGARRCWCSRGGQTDGTISMAYTIPRLVRSATLGRRARARSLPADGRPGRLTSPTSHQTL